MFKRRKYKYFISFWYQMEGENSKIRDCYMEMNQPIERNEQMPYIRQEIRKQVEMETHNNCTFIAIINWKKLK